MNLNIHTDTNINIEMIKIPNLPNQLTRKEIHSRLNKLSISYKTTYLKKILWELYENTLIALKPVFNYNFTGKEYSKPYHSQKINPILWQVGHFILFYLNNVIRLLSYKDVIYKNKEYIIKIISNFNEIINEEEDGITYYDYFDSSITSLPNRIKLLNKFNPRILRDTYSYTIQLLNIYLDNQPLNLNYVDSYLFMLGILHNDMHYEAILFTQHFLNYPKPDNFILPKVVINSPNLNKKKIGFTNKSSIIEDLNIEMIDIEGGDFLQGSMDVNMENNYFKFDNEKPLFNQTVNSFSISKYPITEGQYLTFIENGGYKKRENWTFEGWNWIKEYDINSPLGWECYEIIDSENSNFQFQFIVKKRRWFKRHWGSKILLSGKSKLPIVNISWYEAQAFCKWANFRLPYEKEWEYLATNKGQSNYPWGNENPNISHSNIDYLNGGVLPVDYYDEIDKYPVKQLIGNVWEWCEEVIYPYDGFTIDPVYREMSYPFFGQKRICRGGSWACSNYLITKSYRNAQPPDCRIQWIGFRVCKK